MNCSVVTRTPPQTSSCHTPWSNCSHAASGQIIVSEHTLVHLKSRFELEELPSAKVKGKEKPLRIYNVLRRAARVSVPASAGNPFAAEPTTAVNSG